MKFQNTLWFFFLKQKLAIGITTRLQHRWGKKNERLEWETRMWGRWEWEGWPSRRVIEMRVRYRRGRATVREVGREINGGEEKRGGGRGILGII